MENYSLSFQKPRNCHWNLSLTYSSIRTNHELIIGDRLTNVSDYVRIDHFNQYLFHLCSTWFVNGKVTSRHEEETQVWEHFSKKKVATCTVCKLHITDVYDIWRQTDNRKQCQRLYIVACLPMLLFHLPISSCWNSLEREAVW